MIQSLLKFTDFTGQFLEDCHDYANIWLATVINSEENSHSYTYSEGYAN